MLAGADHSRVSVHDLQGHIPARRISIVHRRRPTVFVGELTAFLHIAASAVNQHGPPTPT
ncbi:hypothetical protein ACGFZS_48245 [Streptomyces sp. NPDC048288]|uniref:hypothetical protein n=1 Tax=Streptomyces sp. NPDC048288 TaxID=3365529 RepID=UPI003720DFC5